MITRGCDVARDCQEDGERRACGHYACDAHTDASEVCLLCVPVLDDEDVDGEMQRAGMVD